MNVGNFQIQQSIGERTRRKIERKNLSGGFCGGLREPMISTKSVQYENDATIILAEVESFNSIPKWMIEKIVTTNSKNVAIAPAIPNAKKRSIILNSMDDATILPAVAPLWPLIT